MLRYYEPYYPDTSRRTSVKLLAIGIIVLLTMSTIVLLLLPTSDTFVPQDQLSQVRVAVIDSGIDSTKVPADKIVAQQSFILTQYGYPFSDTSTRDSHPGGVPHGSIVAEAVLSMGEGISLINAKVISAEGTATTSAVLEAIRWAVDQNCSVINLSLGSSPTVDDPLKEAVEYATSHGVLVVSAAGNSGEDGLGTGSVTSPSIYGPAVSVGALTEEGTPAGYSSIGPAADRYMKPDITAPGYYETSSAIVYGTSFASPRVAGAAAILISFCVQNDIPWTPGLIKAVLMKTAQPMDYPEYLVGAGALDLEAALTMLEGLVDATEVPLVTYVHPHALPMPFERLFYGDIYNFNIQIVNSREAEYQVNLTSSTPEVFEVPATVTVDQSGYIPFRANIPEESNETTFSAFVAFTNDEDSVNVTVFIHADEAVARVAFDISHSTWAIDTTYGQFRQLYTVLTGSGISVSEIRRGTNITAEYLSQYDAVLILDPCVYNSNESDPYNEEEVFYSFTENETNAYREYFESGGGIFVASLSDSYTNITALNEFLNWTGFQYLEGQIPQDSDPDEITSIMPHPITAGVVGFDYLGAPLSVPANATVLAESSEGDAVLGCLDNETAGRLVVTGTNFFIDNWGLNRQYSATDDSVLALQIVLWLTQLL